MPVVETACCRDRVTAVHVVDGAGRDASDPTVVLIHGSGHTARVWGEVQAALRHSSVAIDLPGRADRVAEIADVTLADAATSLAADVDAAVDGPVVLVGHSAGGIVVPGLAARLDGRVVHLVFIAGLCARHGDVVIDTVRPDARPALAARLREMHEEYAGCMLEPHPSASGMRALDARTAAPIDSLNYMHQTVVWDGVPADVPRTFVRCTRDKIQSRELQDALIVNCGASVVIDIETGHTPALAAPETLAAIIDEVTARSRAEPTRAIIDP